MAQPAVGPRARALYLAVVAVGVFLLPAWWMAGLVLVVQIALWLWIGLGVRALLRQIRKLALFLSVILLAYALVSADPATDRWRTVSAFGLAIDVNTTGALAGLLMVLRVLAVVLASQVARAGDARALAAGLGGLGVPRVAALSIDAVLALLGDRASDSGGGRGGGGRGGGGGGRGGGGGGRGGRGGGGRGRDVPARGRLAAFFAGLERLARGDVTILADGLRRHVARAERHIAAATTDDDHGDDHADGRADRRAVSRDVAVIAGIALTMLGIKALKLLPGLPFAPGHKGVVLIPLYVVAGFMTRSRAGATLTGLTMGTVAFLLGDGRYGIFEIAKHVAPGALVDLLMPIARRARRGHTVWMWSAFGVVIALGRFATVTAIAFAVQAPAVVYALLIPGLTIHAIFGVLSGIVTAPLLRALDRGHDPNPPDHAINPRETA